MSTAVASKPTKDDLISVPAEIQRRAWQCAFDLGAEHSAFIGDEARWHWLLDVVVNRGPEALGWRECGALFRLHRHYRQERAT